ncbi:MAG: hypothetical protein IPJ71_09605 [Bdellovibrionales bacterium]|nr:hypothetical protein [Bdellovibrionales bacterium]
MSAFRFLLFPFLVCLFAQFGCTKGNPGQIQSASQQVTHEKIIINYELSNSTARLKIEIHHAGPEGKIRENDQTAWTSLASSSGVWTTSNNDDYFLDQPLTNFTPGSQYRLYVLNPTTTESGSLSLSIPNSTTPPPADAITLDVQVANGKLDIAARNAGPNGEVRTYGIGNWAKFIVPDKWTTDGNNYFLSRPITNYTPGSDFLMEIRNPDNNKSASAQIQIPDRLDREGTIHVKYQVVAGRLKIDVFNAGPLGETKGAGTLDWTRFIVPGKWTTDGNNYSLDRAIVPGEGPVYTLGYRNPERGNEVWFDVDLNKSGGESVAFIYSVANGQFRLAAYGAGSRGETMTDNVFDWTAFLVPSKWSTNGTDYFRTAPLTDYPSGAEYGLRIRNPDTKSQAYIFVKIPTR